MNAYRALATTVAGRRTKWIVLMFWILVMATAGSLAGKLNGAESNNSQEWLPATAQSTQVADQWIHLESPNVFPAVIVYDRPSGITAADKAKTQADLGRFATVSGALTHKVSGPYVSKDGQAIETVVPINLGTGGWSNAPDVAAALRAIAQSGSDPMSVHVSGQLGSAADSENAFKGIDSTLLLAAMAVVIVLLLLTYRSPVLWLLPVLSAAAALTTAEGLVYLLAAHAGVTVNAQTAGILDVLVFGVGTDYALLLTARYREELRRHEDRHRAMAVAIGRAGPAVFASAATIAISLLALSLAELNSTKSMGPVLALGVVVALIAMMTLLPALLVIAGRWVFWPVRPASGSVEPTTRGMWARIGRRIASHPRRVWVSTAVLLGIMAIGLTGLKASGLTNAQSFRGHPDSVVGQSVLAAHFPGGIGSSVQVTATTISGQKIADTLQAVPGLTEVTTPVTADGRAFIQATLTSPPDSQAAYTTIETARAAVGAIPDADALVGGTTASNLDTQNASAHDRNLIIPVILGIVLIILALLLRSLVAPLMLIATVVLSFAATLGLSAVLFNHVFHFGGADATFPLLAFVFLVALGIDYNIFLMTRVHEETRRVGARAGAITGLAATGGVITSAGAVLAGTFAVLTSLPVITLIELGFTVALGVLLDTFVVRSVLVTALNLDLGPKL